VKETRLVFMRGVGEAIVIGGNVVVTIEARRGNQVSVSVTAPRSLSVDRKEVHDRRHQHRAGAERPTPKPDTTS
jgi:carbon storage regulator CsrA